MKKRIISIILSIVMLVGLLPVAALAVEVANWSAVTGSQDTAITLTSSVTIPEGTYNLSGKTVTFGGTATISGSVTITNGKILRGTGNKEALFSVGSGASLTLESITVDGNKSHVTATNPLIDISNGGTVNLNANALLTNNENNDSGEGSAVTVNAGTLNILGGEIKNNQCTASKGGSTIKTYYGSNVKMTAGEISGNSNTNHGGAIQVYGRDPSNENRTATTTFTMEGGTISNNTAGGVGGGIAVSNYSAFIMIGGTIKDNATSDYYKRGGGVGFADANTTMSISGNAVITGNTAGGTTNNLYIGTNTNNLLEVTGALSGANIGITTSRTDAFTTSGSGITPADYINQFSSDNTRYVVAADGDNLKLAETPTYTVTFDMNGHGTAINPATVNSGEKVTKPADPTATGYTFGGWYKDSGLTTAWDFENDTITGPTTIYAKWTGKNAVSITETAQTYTWDNNPKSFAITGTPNTGFAVQYKVNDNWTTTAPSAVGTYDVKITRAEDNTYKAYEKTITDGLVINAAAPEATAPTAKTGLVYDGNAKSLINAGTSGHGHWKYSLDGTSYSSDIPTGTDTDTYAVYCRFVPNTGYANIDPVELSVTIAPMEVYEPTVVGSYTYTGSERTVTLNGFNGSYMTIAGNKGTNAGDYEAVITLDSNHTWNTGSDGKVTWSIAKAALTATASSHTVTYGTAAPTYTVSYTGWLKGEETPTTAAALTSEYTTTSNVGEYAVTFETAPVFANYSVTTENGKVTVERAKTAKEPTKTDRTYTGEAQNGYTNAGTHVTLSETSSATDVGNYQFKATPESNYAWSDGSTEAKTYNWSIVKATAEITVDQTAIVKTFGETLTLPTATSNFGEVVCDKTAEDLVNVGSYTVTYTVAGTDNYGGGTKTVSVTINQLAVNEPSVTGTYTYTGKEQTATVTGKEAYMTETGDVKGTDAGDYTITYTLDGNHCWADGSDGTVTWSIGKTDMVQGVNITAPSDPVSGLVYTGEALELLCAGLTIDERDGASFGTFYYSVDGTDWSTNLPTAINAGKYNPVWYFVGDGNHNNFGSAEEPISQPYPIEISKRDQAVATVTMENYTYGGTLPNPSISITPSESAAVTYYYSATNTTTDGTEWKDMTAKTLNAGTYYMYAVIAATDNFGSQTTAAAAFTVAKAYVTAPASGEGYTVDYVNEKITPDSGYEVSTTSGDNFATGKLNNETTIDFTKTYYIRKAEDTNHNTSAETPYTPARPVAPTESNFSATRETVENKKDGSFGGITAEMQYSINGGNWTSGPAMLTDLSNETVKVRYTATTEAFKSEEYSYTFEASTARLTVSFGDDAESQQLAYGAKVDKPTDPEKTGYTFGGWYSDEELTQAWNFDADTVTDNMTLYPKWIRNNVQKAVITGNVTEDSSNVIGATVELFLGTVKVAATVTKDDPAGDYSFDNVENGVYNIVVTKADGSKTKTELVTVDRTDSFSVNVVLPASAVNSIVEVEDTQIGEAKSEISKTVVGGLDTIAAAQNPEAGQTITIKLKVEPKEESDVTSAAEIKQTAGNGKNVEFLDMSLWKQVDNGTATDIGDDNTQLLTIVIPFDFTKVEVSSIMILRKHGSGNAEKLTKNPASGQEGFTVDRQTGTITVYAMKFSDYALAYDMVHEHEWDTAFTVPATGHSFGEWITVTSVTCSGGGSEKRVCSVCGYTETRNLDPAGHEWESDFTVDKEPACTEDGSKSIHCKHCDAVKDSAVISHTEHKWGSETVVKEATKTEDGEKTYTCERCGEVKHIVIPKTGDAHKCIVHWFMIALLVLFVILFAVFALLKKKLLAFITCGVCGVLAIVLAFFGGCVVCTVFTVVNLVVIAAGILFTVFRKNASNDDDDRDNDKSEAEQQE